MAGKSEQPGTERRENLRRRVRPVPGSTRSRAGAPVQGLRELARRYGIITSYLDTEGNCQEARPATLRAILALWGVASGTCREVEDALRDHTQQSWARGIEPVLVAWEGKRSRAEVRLPAHLQGAPMKCVVHLEQGGRRVLRTGPSSLRGVKSAVVEGSAFVVRHISLPRLPRGYHQLEIEIGHWRRSALLIAAPAGCYWPPDGGRRLGMFLPLYAAHSERSWGAGDFGDLRALAGWFAAAGGGLVSTLPLLGGFLGRPFCEPSPYSPATRLFWNEFYVDIEQVPEFAACAAARRLVDSRGFQARLEAFHQDPRIDYDAQMKARRAVLERLAEFFFKQESPRRRAFERFLRERPAAEDYARFRAAVEKTGQSWQKWPARMRQGELRRGDYVERVRDYHLYTQWLAQEQVAGFRSDCARRRLQFYLDLPLGVNGAGYDPWREQASFAAPASAGAPPDFFFTKGQNWGFPPLHPERMRVQGYRHLRDYLAFQMRHCDLLRIDHVMSLHRLYWIPPGFPPSQGAYVAYRPEELYAVLSLESHRHRVGVVGENLGTVPPEVNQAMARHRLRQMYVVQYQQRPGPGPALPVPPRRAVASLNTHDMPTFAAHWRGLDISDRVDLGLVRRGEAARKRAERERMNAALARFLHRASRLKVTDSEELSVLSACLEWLSRGPADVVLLNLEDLWQETEPQNVPGTSAERPNWRRKARLTLEQITRSPQLADLVQSLARSRTRPRKAGGRPHA